MIDLRPDCIHQWKLNDVLPTPNVIDNISSNDGTLFGGANSEDSYTAEANPPNMNGSFAFSPYFTLDTLITLAVGGNNGYTIVFWAKGNNASPGPGVGSVVCGNRDEANNAFGMLNGARFVFIDHTGTEFTWTDDTDFYQQWRHVVLQYREAAAGQGPIRLWLDSVVQGAAKWGVTPEFHLKHIGAGTGVPISNFNGWIDNFLVFKDVISGIGAPFILSQNDIDFLYNDGVGTERLREIVRPKINSSLANGTPLVVGGLA